MDNLRRTVYAFGVARVETIESSTVMVVYLLIRTGSRYIADCHFGFFTSIYQDRQRVEPGGHAVLSLAVACNFASGELPEHLSIMGFAWLGLVSDHAGHCIDVIGRVLARRKNWYAFQFKDTF